MWTWNDGTELYHHGILGQKWGRRNGPPYPLDAKRHSASEKKAGWRKSLNKDSKEESSKKLKLTDKQKKALIIGGVAAATALVVIGGVYLYETKKLDSFINTGMNNVGIGQPSVPSFEPDNKTINITTSVPYELNQRIESLEVTDPSFLEQPEYWDSMPNDIKQSIEEYTDFNESFYKEINEALANPDIERSKYTSKQIDNIKKAIDGSVLDRDIVTYRGITADRLPEILPNVDLNNKYEIAAQKGKKINIQSFYSSSLSFKIARDYSKGNVEDNIRRTGTILTTICPKGTKGLYIANHSTLPDELEFLIQCNNNYRILEIVQDESGYPEEIIVEVLGVKQ